MDDNVWPEYCIRFYNGKSRGFDFYASPSSIVAAVLAEKEPVTVIVADMVVHFGIGFISAIDLFTGQTERKDVSLPERNALLHLLLVGDDNEACYEIAEKWLVGFKARFIP